MQQRTTGTSSADISSITPYYRLGAGHVVPGLEITFPSGWQTTERTAAELRLESGRLDSGVIRIWSDMIPGEHWRGRGTRA